MGAVTWGVPTPVVDVVRAAEQLRVCVETGTYRGGSTALLAARFDRVITIEAGPDLAAAAAARLGTYPNVECLCGDSRRLLPEVVRALDEPALFWLDSHYCGPETHGARGQCPVLEEIATVVGAAQPHVLLIDDARLFLAPPPRPLDPAQWPSIDEICRAIAGGALRRFVAVHDDVILAVPESCRQSVVDWLVEQATRREVPRHRRPIAAAGRVVRRLLSTGRDGGRA
jgi:hypothetical protein